MKSNSTAATLVRSHLHYRAAAVTFDPESGAERLKAYARRDAIEAVDSKVAAPTNAAWAATADG
jgi:hypothetical protein